MVDLTKIKIDIKNGVASIIDLTPEQAQEIWDRCAEVEGTKRFTKKELYEYLQYMMYCQFYEKNPQSCESHKLYQDFLNKESKVHFGDCIKQPCACSRCHLHMIEIEAQNALESIWNGPKGHCSKICVTECEGIPKKENNEQ